MTGCSGVTEEAENIVKNELKDPSSAQFRLVEEYSGSVCGEVNGKNGFGGYVGFRRFMYDKAIKSAVIQPEEELSPDAKRMFGGLGNIAVDKAAFDKEFSIKCR